MNCLPLANRFKNFRRILSKMLPTSKRTSEEQVLIDSGKESASLDYDNSSYFPSPSSCYERDSVDFRSTNGFNRDAINNNKYAVPSTYLRSFSHSSKSSQSSGYESSWIKPPPLISHSIFKDPSSSFDSMLSPFKSFTSNDEASNFTQSSQSSDSVSYSPLSSFNFAEHKLPADFYSDLNFDDLSSPLQAENQAFHDALRHDFEMNGKTVDVEATSTFSPMISSTPMTNRKSHQGQLQDKENSQQRLNQQSSPNQEWSKNKRNHKRRFKPNKKSLEDHCVFCKNNGAHEKVYRNHTVKDSMGRVLCPVLRLYKCPICGEDGDRSHTVKYCPKKPIITLEDIQRMDNKAFK